MYCKYCGKQTSDSKDFCMNCGASLAAGAYDRKPLSEIDKKSKAPIVVLWSVIAVLTIVGTAAYSIVWKNRPKEEAAQDVQSSVNEADYDDYDFDEIDLKPAETTKESYYMSESTAKAIAEEYIKDKYDEYAPVVIGTVTCDSNVTDSDRTIGTVRVAGHYWKTDYYGHSDGSENFSETVHIDKETQRAW